MHTRRSFIKGYGASGLTLMNLVEREEEGYYTESDIYTPDEEDVFLRTGDDAQGESSA